MLKLVIVITILWTIAASPATDRSTLSDRLNLMLEEACVRQGGFCIRIEDCEPNNLVQLRGVLCPAQKHLGVECCYL